ELARQVEVARQQAAKETAARGEAARRAQEQQRQRAADQLLAQARQALAQGNPKQAVQLLESAAALNPSDAINRELARARSAVQELEKTRAAAEQRRQEADVRKQRDDPERARARAAEEAATKDRSQAPSQSRHPEQAATARCLARRQGGVQPPVAARRRLREAAEIPGRDQSLPRSASPDSRRRQGEAVA